MARQITMLECLKGRDKLYPKEYNKTIEMNLFKTIQTIDEFLKDYNGFIVITSGWRDQASNKAAGGAPNSKHCTGEAIDIQDKDGSLRKYVLANLDKAQELGLFFEHMAWTPIWIHCQIVPPKSGHRIYVPNTLPPKDPNIIVKYNDKYDLLIN